MFGRVTAETIRAFCLLLTFLPMPVTNKSVSVVSSNISRAFQGAFLSKDFYAPCIEISPSG